MSNDTNKGIDNAEIVLLAVIGILLITNVAILITHYFTPLNHPPLEKPQTRQYTETKNTQQLEPIAIITGEKAKCEADNCANNKKRSNKSVESSVVTHVGNPDIAAQEGMWIAANYLVALTFIQILIGGATIFLVAKAYLAQRSELSAANRAADAAENALRESKNTNAIQLTPYLELIDVEVNWAGMHDEHGWLDIFLTIENIGATPAVEFSDVCITSIGYQIIPASETNLHAVTFEYLYIAGDNRNGLLGNFTSGTSLTVLAPKGSFTLFKTIGMVPDKRAMNTPEIWDEFSKAFFMADREMSAGFDAFKIPEHEVHYLIEFEFWFKDTITGEDRGCRGIVSEGTAYTGNLRGISINTRRGKPAQILIEDGKTITERGADAKYKAENNA